MQNKKFLYLSFWYFNPSFLKAFHKFLHPIPGQTTSLLTSSHLWTRCVVLVSLQNKLMGNKRKVFQVMLERNRERAIKALPRV